MFIRLQRIHTVYVCVGFVMCMGFVENNKKRTFTFNGALLHCRIPTLS